MMTSIFNVTYETLVNFRRLERRLTKQNIFLVSFSLENFRTTEKKTKTFIYNILVLIL